MKCQVDLLFVCVCETGIGAFLMYSIHEGIRGISLDPGDSSEALMPLTGTLFAVGLDFHAGDRQSAPVGYTTHLISSKASA